MNTTYGTKTDYWIHSETNGFDLTRGNSLASTSISTNKGLIKFTPIRSALIIIDMQNFFLHPSIRTHTTGLAAMKQLIEVAIPAAKKSGMPIIWCNWGLTDEDVSKMQGAHASSFGAMLRTSEGKPSAGFGFEMGTIAGKDAGRLLFRESWNAALYGELQKIYEDGLKDGSSVWIHKDRMSGMWGNTSLLQEYLIEKDIKTLYFTGVNTDQCVWGTLIDAHNKGYDTVLIKDCCGTNSPDACRIATEFNAELVGFSTTAKEFAKGLK